ncbi:hypothetical protein O3597_25740 [Verrucosispora sp. WMMA2044]|uniref:hypothetical protein n=1 Tax=Verrucosispora sp. WMMA2044 TaxID=3016419 RepID=UPI00248AC3C0|nr:hypothetical protein [Verrucosispora sp. WMMA2044]WBB48444.1 hypothetical protein O3597_25740 [Verrucosispora sp. WMMA2044]
MNLTLVTVLSTASAVGAAVATELATGMISDYAKKVARTLTRGRGVNFDVRLDGLFPLGMWSPARQLEPHRLITEHVSKSGRPGQEWIDSTKLANQVDIAKRMVSGNTVYLTGFKIDHRESEGTQYCRITLAPSEYPEVLAIERLRAEDPDSFTGADSAIEQNVRRYLERPVPSSLAANIVLVSQDGGRLLCVERSAATDSAVGWWTVGVFETMKQPDFSRPGFPEDLYGLIMRGLNEELGLTPDCYGRIFITWLGILQSILRGHVVAVVRIQVDDDAFLERTRIAHSGYEHAAISWVPFKRKTVESFINAPRRTHDHHVGSTVDVGGRTWIEQSRLAVLEAWRFRSVI